MNIEAKDFELKMTHGELWTLAFDVRSALEFALTTHWINHQSKWEENEKPRLQRIEQMFNCLGRPDLYNEVFAVATEIFKKFNAKRNTDK